MADLSGLAGFAVLARWLIPRVNRLTPIVQTGLLVGAPPQEGAGDDIDSWSMVTQLSYEDCTVQRA